ncbi:Outer membrane receptor for ferrienterochelin and colicin [Flavobacterium daejeonense]|nr:Outer membrane receptor for ferrienterochelin and colicin [Flavobacterium daejeonense]
MPANTWAQENELKVSNASFAEKIYLQLDKKVYTNGDTVWFKCIVSNASENILSVLSNVLYVELIGADEVIRQKKLIKIENGIGQGSFDLDKKIPKGNYLIRAYTQWNQNFDTDFIFEEYIQVFTNETTNSEPIPNIKLIKEETADDHLEVLFNPKVIDSLHKNKLIVYLSVDDKKDSLLLKKDKNDRYILDYDITKGSQFATLKMETENGKFYTKTVVLNKDYIDLQFFPESGQLVQGLTSKVAFKALDANGKGKIVEGDIIDENQTVLTAFKSNTLGMGLFFIPNADSTKNYYARLKSSSLKFKLPKVATTGTILSVNKQGDKVLVTALSNYLQNDSIYLRISFRGIELYEKKIHLNQGLYSSLIATTDIPEGIVVFTLLDHAKNPIAERLYFNEKPQSRIQIKLSTDKNTYAKRALTILNIETTNDGNEPIKANTSILVINKEELGNLQSLRQNILSYFLIDSELKGNIENPGYYFKNETKNFNDLEALMLTQGWSKYNYAKSYKSLSFIPEKSLTVSGKVSKIFSETKGQKDIQLTMMTSGKNKGFYTQVTDSLGKFNFNLNDEYGKEIEVLIQTAKKSDKKTNNPIVIDYKIPPSIFFEHNKTVEQIDSIVAPFIRKSMKQKEIDDKLDLQFGSIVLNEVSITNNSNPNRKKVTERYGKPKTVISGREILSKEQKWSYGLYSVLSFNYPDKVRIKQTEEGYLYASVHNMPTVVMIDGILIPFTSYPHIPDISPSEITSFEIIEYANGFIDLYCQAHPEIQNCKANPELLYGHIIAIYTHAGVGLSGAYKPKGLTKTTIPVFSRLKEYYAPKYENIQPDNWQHPDIRSLVLWQPILKTNNSGKALASFYNTDNKGKMTIVVEAISEKGEIGYQELDYKVSD